MYIAAIFYLQLDGISLLYRYFQNDTFLQIPLYDNCNSKSYVIGFNYLNIRDSKKAEPLQTLPFLHVKIQAKVNLKSSDGYLGNS